MKRIDTWKTCNRKNPELEKFLAGTSEKNIIRGKMYTEKEQVLVNKNTSIIIECMQFTLDQEVVNTYYSIKLKTTSIFKLISTR